VVQATKRLILLAARIGSYRSCEEGSACRARWYAADFEQLKPEGLYLGEHAVQRGLVRQRSRQHRFLSARLSPEGRERGANRVAQVATHIDLVLPRLWPAVCAGYVVTAHEADQLLTVVP
jgi:hypothetical protein